MTPLGLVALAAVVLGVAALGWWLVVTTEGVYLGRRVVVWLYDVYAARYDRIKSFDSFWEAATLAEPISEALQNVDQPLMLDVATGTGRLPQTLLADPDFAAYMVGLDYSRRMLTGAARNVAAMSAGTARRVTFIHQDALHLPFPDGTFDAVFCLEALEFLPNIDAALAEMVRVARPGALFLLTNRRKIFMPGKVRPGAAFAERLRSRFGLEDVTISPWQVDYELVWAFKPGLLDPALEQDDSRAPFDPTAMICCPRCGNAALIRSEGQAGRGLVCTECEARVPIAPDGVIEYATASPN